jgi:hypothetical protein
VAGLSAGTNALPPAGGRFAVPYDDYEWEWERHPLPIHGALAASGVASGSFCEVSVSVWRNDEPDRRRTRTRWVYGLASK